MSFPVYTALYGFVGLAAAPYYFFRAKKGGDRDWSISDRLALGMINPPPKNGVRLWVHALSLGEVIQAEGVVRELVGQGYEVVLTTTTRSGREMAEQRFPDLYRSGLPLDWPAAVRRFLDSISPDGFVLVETDIWPNILAELSHRRIPAILAGARLSPRSYRGYKALGRFWTRVLNHFMLIGCQSGRDRERFLSLGVSPEKLVLTGNLKYDRPEPLTGPRTRSDLLKTTGLSDRRWLVAGSTHQGEEEIILDVFKTLRQEIKELGLILAPRNRERFEAVWRLVEREGWRSGRRTASDNPEDPEVFLLDTYGELDGFYELGEVVFIGKSLNITGESGGHNPLEAAVRGKPVVFGPRMHNFSQVSELMVASGGGRQVKDAAELRTVLYHMLSDGALRDDMGRKAREAIAAHRGALKRTVDLIKTAGKGAFDEPRN